ncbi:MAG TPA: methyltransferase domain-containing protein [Vicinamibacterales bacterium]
MSPSPFIVEWLHRLGLERSGGRALDVAMGSGRHAAAIAGAGFRPFGVDRDLGSLRTAVADGAARGVRIDAWCADLVTYTLPPGRFDVIVVARYLQRDLFPSLVNALTPAGVLLYETFTTAQRAHGVGPTSADHLLAPGELRRSLAALDLLFYEEVSAPEAVARLVGRRAASRS